MGLLTEIVNRIRMYPQPVVQVYLNKNTLDLLNDEIDHLSENDYSKIAYVQPVEQTKEFSYGLECACSHVVTTEKYEPCQNFLF